MQHLYKFVLAIILALPIVEAQAQQEPLFAQYTTNAFLINPAVAGSQGGHSLRIFHRWQWVSFPGAPTTYGVNYQGLVKDLHGIGGLIFADNTGPLRRWGAKAAYAFHIPLQDKKTRLSLGLAGRYSRHKLRTNNIDFIEAGDQAVANADKAANLFDAEFGIFYHAPKFYVGIAAPNLFQSKLDFGTTQTNRDPIGYGYVHYFLTAGYRFAVGDVQPKLDSLGNRVGTAKGVVFEPSIMVKYVKGAQVQVDAGIMAHFLENQISFGMFYRSPKFLSFQCKFVFDRKMPLLLSFDVALNSFQKYSVGATEVMMGYDFTRTNMYSVPAVGAGF